MNIEQYEKLKLVCEQINSEIKLIKNDSDYISFKRFKQLKSVKDIFTPENFNNKIKQFIDVLFFNGFLTGKIENKSNKIKIVTDKSEQISILENLIIDTDEIIKMKQTELDNFEKNKEYYKNLIKFLE